MTTTAKQDQLSRMHKAMVFAAVIVAAGAQALTLLREEPCLSDAASFCERLFFLTWVVFFTLANGAMIFLAEAFCWRSSISFFLRASSFIFLLAKPFLVIVSSISLGCRF
jgi:hypothetical protein